MTTQPAPYTTAKRIDADTTATANAAHTAARDLFTGLTSDERDTYPADAARLSLKLAQRATASIPEAWRTVAALLDSNGFFEGIEDDPVGAITALRRGADGLDANAAVLFARKVYFIDEDKVPTDFLAEQRTHAGKILAELIAVDKEVKEPQLRTLAGYMYARGEGYPKDPMRARELFNQAAEKGDADAYFELYIFDTTGVTGDPDPQAAFEHLAAAAIHGNARAMANLGGMYATGNQVEQDEEKSLFWYTKAAHAGNAKAAHALCVMYATGEGAPQDAELARKYMALWNELAG